LPAAVTSSCGRARLFHHHLLAALILAPFWVGITTIRYFWLLAVPLIIPCQLCHSLHRPMALTDRLLPLTKLRSHVPRRSRRKQLRLQAQVPLVDQRQPFPIVPSRGSHVAARSPALSNALHCTASKRPSMPNFQKPPGPQPVTDRVVPWSPLFHVRILEDYSFCDPFVTAFFPNTSAGDEVPINADQRRIDTWR
jgi:hypothetical protein